MVEFVSAKQIGRKTQGWLQHMFPRQTKRIEAGRNTGELLFSEDAIASCTAWVLGKQETVFEERG